MKVFQKNKDIDLYNYFSPKTREYLFSSFSHSGAKLEKLEELPDDTKSAILSKYPCTIFEYELKEDIQGKAEEKGMKKENIYYFENREEILELLEKIAKKGDIILFKASNGMKFFELANRIESEEFWTNNIK